MQNSDNVLAPIFYPIEIFDSIVDKFYVATYQHGTTEGLSSYEIKANLSDSVIEWQ